MLQKTARIKKIQPASKGVPKVPPVQGDVVQSGGIDNAGEISQGLFKEAKLTGINKARSVGGNAYAKGKPSLANRMNKLIGGKIY